MNLLSMFDWVAIYYLILFLLGLLTQIKGRQRYSQIFMSMFCDAPIFGRVLNWW